MHALQKRQCLEFRVSDCKFPLFLVRTSAHEFLPSCKECLSNSRTISGSCSDLNGFCLWYRKRAVRDDVQVACVPRLNFWDASRRSGWPKDWGCGVFHNVYQMTGDIPEDALPWETQCARTGTICVTEFATFVCLSVLKSPSRDKWNHRKILVLSWSFRVLQPVLCVCICSKTFIRIAFITFFFTWTSSAIAWTRN